MKRLQFVKVLHAFKITFRSKSKWTTAKDVKHSTEIRWTSKSLFSLSVNHRYTESAQVQEDCTISDELTSWSPNNSFKFVDIVCWYVMQAVLHDIQIDPWVRSGAGLFVTFQERGTEDNIWWTSATRTFSNGYSLLLWYISFSKLQH